jgi:hypothetical protein
MMALVESLCLEEICSGAGSGDRAFAIPVEADNVVGAGLAGAFTIIVTVCCYRVVQDASRELKFGVYNSAGWVCKGNQLVLDGGIKGDMPEQGCVGVQGALDDMALLHGVDLHVAANGPWQGEPHAAGTSTEDIMGPQQCWLGWDQLLKSCRVIAHAVREPLKSLMGRESICGGASGQRRWYEWQLAWHG